MHKKFVLLKNRFIFEVYLCNFSASPKCRDLNPKREALPQVLLFFMLKIAFLLSRSTFLFYPTILDAFLAQQFFLWIIPQSDLHFEW